MPRTLSIPEASYTVREYGPLEINNFGSANTDWLEVTFTVVDWPAAAPLFTGQLLWNTGDGANFEVNSPPKDRQGNLLSVVRVRVSVPQDARGKADVNSATIMFNSNANFRTAVTISAVANP